MQDTRKIQKSLSIFFFDENLKDILVWRFKLVRSSCRLRNIHSLFAILGQMQFNCS